MHAWRAIACQWKHARNEANGRKLIDACMFDDRFVNECIQIAIVKRVAINFRPFASLHAGMFPGDHFWQWGTTRPNLVRGDHFWENFCQNLSWGSL